MAAWSDRAAESGPTVLATPRVGLAGVPSGAIGTDRIQVPVVLRRVVVVVRGSNVRGALAAAASAGAAATAVALAVLGRRAVVIGVATIAILAATQIVGAGSSASLPATVLRHCVTYQAQ